MAKNIIYLELANNYLLLGWLKKVKNSFSLTKIKTIELKNSELLNGILFNPSQLYLYIKDFLKRDKTKNAKAIINLPELSEKKNLHINLSTLQNALCFTKAGLKIEKIISNPFLIKEKEKMEIKNFFWEKELKNQLDFFKPFTTPPNPPTKWLAFSGLLLFCCIAFLFNIGVQQKNKLNLLLSKNLKLDQQNNSLQQKIKQLFNAEQQNQQFTNNLSKIQKIKTASNNPEKLLNSIAQSIPQNCWVTNITFEKKPKGKPTTVDIQGATANEQEASIFIKNLTKLKQLTSLKLVNLQKIKEVKASNLKQNKNFNFKITGVINSKTK